MQTGALEEKTVKLLEPGDMFGDYTVEKLLGKGGMGAVYLVRSPDGERYAVKVMFPEIAEKNPDYRTRFAREAEFAMTLRHKNLISVYDAGEDPDTGLCYIIMDYMPGGSVKDRLHERGSIPVAEAVSITAQIALALELAHRHGVIHRDIKPDNIMFDADGTPKLADLGVAKFTDEAHKTTVTTTGMIIGTPAYMAPEQMMDSHHIDARADIYALGVVLYEMLTGKRPNEGSTAVELLAKALKGEPLPDVRTMRPEISAAIAHVLSLMCAPKPEDRPPTTLAVAQLLQQAATGQLKLPKKKPRASDAQKAKRPFPVAACVMGALVLGAAVFGWRAWSSRQKTSTGATGVPPVAAVTSTALPTGTGVSPLGGDVRGSGARAVSSASDEKLPKETSPKPKDLSLDLGGGVKMEMVGCPAGKFWMGVKPGEYHGKIAIRKGHVVEISRPFWVGKFPVLVGEWERLMSEVQLPVGVQREKSDLKLPVQAIAGTGGMGLTALSAEEFMSKLTSKFRSKLPRGYVFRFPTEAEWEYALKANSTTTMDPYSNLNASQERVPEYFTLMEDSVNYWTKRGYHPKYTPDSGWYVGPYPPVGNKKPNAWGIYDMGGITAEPMLDSWVCTADEWTGGGMGEDRLGHVVQEHPAIRENGLKDPLLFDADRPGTVRMRWTRQGFNIKHHPIISRNALMYWFGHEKPLAQAGLPAIMLRLVVGPDLLKERGITPPVPNNSSPATPAAQSDRGGGTLAASSASGEKLPKETSPKPKNISLDLGGGVKMEMVGCPAGSFMMGYDNVANGDREPLNKPHKVIITRPFWIAKYPLTPRMIEVLGVCPEVSERVKKEQMRIWDEIGLQVPYNPLARAPVPAFVQAKIFRHLNEKIKDRPQGYIFRCPTAAEWEYAVKADESDPTFVDANLSNTSVIHAIWGETVQAKRFLGEFTYFRDHPQDNRITWMMPLGYTKPNPWGLQALLVGRTFMLDSVDPDKIVKAGGWSRIRAIKDNECLSSPEQDPVYVAVRTPPDKCQLARGSMALSQWDFPERGSCSVLVTLGPDLLKERGITPPVPSSSGQDARSPSGAVSPSAEPFRLLSERPQPLTITLGKGEQLELMGCPAGTFTMGCEGCGPHHTPHKVTISRPFWAGKYPVTRAQWDFFMPPRQLNELEIALGGPKGAVGSVSRKEAEEYCQRLTKKYQRYLPNGYIFRLPTLAETEYFWRAGSTDPKDPYSKPRNLSQEQRNTIALGDEDKKAILQTKGITWDPQKYFHSHYHTPSAQVGLRKSNAWGLYDLSGNVFMWVLDTVASEKSRGLKWGIGFAKDFDFNWAGGSTDPLIYCDEGVDGTGVRWGDSRMQVAWGEINIEYVKPAFKTYCLSQGFRVVAGPDLVKEKMSGNLFGVVAGKVRSITVFPRADAQNTKWKKRAPWRYTTKVPTADWAEPAFRDGTWKRTNKPLGFGKDVALMRMADRWTTNDLWLRRHFTWKAAKVTRVVFDMIHDENVEIYLNGTRILEESGSNDRWEPFEISVETFTSAVREGDNVLAVKVHDGAAPRYFDCGLTVETEEVK